MDSGGIKPVIDCETLLLIAPPLEWSTKDTPDSIESMKAQNARLKALCPRHIERLINRGSKQNK